MVDGRGVVAVLKVEWRVLVSADRSDRVPLWELLHKLWMFMSLLVDPLKQSVHFVLSGVW